MYCKNCGLQIDDNAKFCPSCGQSTSDPVVKPKETQGEPLSQKPKKKRSTGLKVLFWILGIIAALVVLFIVLIIVSPEPKFNEQPRNLEEYIGVWQVVGTQEHYGDDVKAVEPDDNMIFSLIMDNNELISLEVNSDNTIVGSLETSFIYKEDHLEIPITETGYPAGSHYRFYLNEFGNLYHVEWYDGGPQSEIYSYLLADEDPEAFLKPILEQFQGEEEIIETMQTEPSSQAAFDAMVDGLDRNIATSIMGKRWESNGYTIPLQSTEGLPSGYPREHANPKGAAVYEFDTDTMMLTLTNYENGVQTGQVVKPFQFSGNTYITAFEREQNIDGKSHMVQSVYFISNGTLYECESVDGIDASNYLAHSDVGASTGVISSQAAFDAMVAGLDRNVATSIAGKRWESNGNTIALQSAEGLPSGYPREFPNPKGAAVYEFDVNTMKLILTNYEDGAQTGQVVKPFQFSGNTYISAFERQQNIDGKSYVVKSVYFISNGTLYECESVDGIDASNYLAHSPQ